jgi:hypothetical protein
VELRLEVVFTNDRHNAWKSAKVNSFVFSSPAAGCSNKRLLNAEENSMESRHSAASSFLRPPFLLSGRLNNIANPISNSEALR